jgi:prephenate dehydrogenase
MPNIKPSVGIIGVGLLGGSIALAALRSGYDVFLYDPISCRVGPSNLKNANICPSLSSLVSQAQLIFIAAPISAITEIARDLAQIVTRQHVISDVASVKKPIAEILKKTFTDCCQYVPTHPMAGSEKSGIDSARVDLFDNAVTILNPEFCDDPAAIRLVTRFWEDIGARVATCSADEHDQIVAAISHLPHLIAALLVKQAALSGSESLNLSGPGFRDTTRIASGSPQLWTEILSSNAESVRAQLLGFRELLDKTLAMLEAKDMKELQNLLTEAKESRDRVLL